MTGRDQWVVVTHRDGAIRSAFILDSDHHLARQFAAYVEDELGCEATLLRALSPVRELLNWRAYGGTPDTEDPPRMWDAEWHIPRGRTVTNIPLPGMEQEPG